jgi:predicted phage terminase large subunit-like protein
MTVPVETGVVDSILRIDFLSFIEKCFRELNSGTTYRPNWHIEAMAHELERCRTGVNKRLIITVPPRSLKSLCASIAFPAFLLGHDPSQRLINVSYSQELGIKFASGFRQVANSNWYQRLFRATRAVRDTESEFETTRGGGRVSISIGGSMLGRGGNFIIIDDPLKAEEALSRSARDRANDYYRTSIPTRLDSKRDGVIVLVMQRLHAEDLAGRLINEGGWTHLNLPAIATRDERIALTNGRWHFRKEGDVLHPEREPRAILDELRRTLGSMHFQAQYQQEPVSETGNIIKRDWIKYYDTAPSRSAGTTIVQSWDTAMKGDQIHDYSVCTTWLKSNGNHYLIDLVRRRCEYPALIQLLRQQHQRHSPDSILIEDKGTGTSLIQDLRYNHQITPIAIKPEGDKATRLSTASLIIEQGKVFFPEQGPWLGDLLNELLRFPQTQFDDQADSVSQYLIWDRERGRYGRFEVDWM